MSEIEIYTKDWCGYCRAAKQLLDRLGYRYRDIDVTHDMETYSAMVKRADGRTSVPQIFLDGTGIGGYTELSALARTGKLPPP
jgi:glutaredoxin 3